MEFTPLNNDNDLLMIGEETFTVSLLKSLTQKSLDKKYQSPINNTNSNILLLFKENYFQ